MSERLISEAIKPIPESIFPSVWNLFCYYLTCLVSALTFVRITGKPVTAGRGWGFMSEGSANPPFVIQLEPIRFRKI